MAGHRDPLGQDPLDKDPLDQEDPELPWACCSCHKPITPQNGVSPADDGEPVVCRACWRDLAPAERIEAARRWRMQARLAKTLDTAVELMRGALDGYHLPGLGEAGRN